MSSEHQTTKTFETSRQDSRSDDSKKDETRSADDTVDGKEAASGEGDNNTGMQYAHGPRLWLTMVALFLGMFVANLDATIIGELIESIDCRVRPRNTHNGKLATAIPGITNDFHSLSDIGWYGTALLITFAAVQTMWGKMFKYFPLKATHLTTLAIFELGSLVCAVTPTSAGLIAGRAIAGVGAAGLCVSIPPVEPPVIKHIQSILLTLVAF